MSNRVDLPERQVTFATKRDFAEALLLDQAVPKAEFLGRWSMRCTLLSHHYDMFTRKLVGAELTGQPT
jgi:hypothetical protein